MPRADARRDRAEERRRPPRVHCRKHAPRSGPSRTARPARGHTACTAPLHALARPLRSRLSAVRRPGVCHPVPGGRHAGRRPRLRARLRALRSAGAEEARQRRRRRLPLLHARARLVRGARARVCLREEPVRRCSAPTGDSDERERPSSLRDDDPGKLVLVDRLRQMGIEPGVAGSAAIRAGSVPGNRDQHVGIPSPCGPHGPSDRTAVEVREADVHQDDVGA